MNNIVSLDATRNLLRYAKVVRGVTAYAAYMAPSTYVVFMVILSHTIAVGKKSVTLSLRQLADGVEAKHDNGWTDQVQCGLSMTTQTIRKALRELKEQEYITVVKNVHKDTGSNMPSTITVTEGTESFGSGLDDLHDYPREVYDATDCLQLSGNIVSHR